MTENGKTYGQILQHLQFLARVPNRLKEKFKAEDKDENTNHHDWDIANDNRSHEQDTNSSYGKHNTGQPPSATGSYE